MATTDGKLYRIFVMAGERKYASRAELSREIAKQKFDEFSYEENGETRYLGWRGVDDYVAFSSMIGLLIGELEPYVRTDQVTRRGFELTLGEKVEAYAEGAGFGAQKLRNGIRGLITKTPAVLPSPKAVFNLVGPKCTYQIFYKAVTVRSFQERARLFVRSRHTFLADDVFKE